MGELDRLRWRVFLRDGGCIAAQGDKVGADVATDLCANRYGYTHRWNDLLQMTFEHVRKHAAMGAPKAPDREEQAVTLCWHHGVQGWELSHKDAERAYLRKLYPAYWADEEQGR